jgi:microcystin degradation protein MlrC
MKINTAALLTELHTISSFKLGMASFLTCASAESKQLQRNQPNCMTSISQATIRQTSELIRALYTTAAARPAHSVHCSWPTDAALFLG